MTHLFIYGRDDLRKIDPIGNSEGHVVVNSSGTGRLDIEMLPARHGDSILLSWGPPDDRHRMLVDGGPARAYDDISPRLAEAAAEGPLDLFVMTHIDADHIEGSLMLANDADLALGIGEIWFNGPAQLSRELGRNHGEMFAALISARGLPWNARFGGDGVRADDDRPLPVHDLPGGLRITVLGPDRTSLLKLRDDWLSECENEGLVYSSGEEALTALRAKKVLAPGGATYLSGPETPDIYSLARQPSHNDTSVANESSIVLLAEYGDASVLLAGDATPAALTRATQRLLEERGGDQFPITAFKLPHHGSQRNVTRDLVRALPAAAYLFSSGGHGRPHDVAVARCLEFGRPGPELVFNYRTPQTLLWDPEAHPEFQHGARYPADGATSVSLDVTALAAATREPA